MGRSECVWITETLTKLAQMMIFPLPHIDVLVDSAALSAMYSFAYGFSGYNQVLMAEEDKHKTAFVTK